MLEIRAVVRACGQQHDGGIGNPGRRHAAQIIEQYIRVAVDRRDPMLREQLRKQAHHHLAVFEHVRDAGGHAQVVLEHAEFARLVAHDVDAGDMGIDAAGNIHPLHLRAVLRVAQHLFGRNDAGLEDLLVVINIVNEGVERTHPLLQSVFQTDPLLQGQHPGHDVERYQPFRTLLLAVNRECDADPVEQGIRLGALLRQPVRRLIFEPFAVAQVMGPGRTIGAIHFVVGFPAQMPPLNLSESLLDPPAATPRSRRTRRPPRDLARSSDS